MKVRSFLKNESELSYKADLVSVLKGTDEGAYQWVSTYSYINRSRPQRLIIRYVLLVITGPHWSSFYYIHVVHYFNNLVHIGVTS